MRKVKNHNNFIVSLVLFCCNYLQTAEDVQTAFIQAIRAGDSGTIQALRPCIKDIDAAPKKLTFLMHAIKHQRGSIFTELLQAGASVNAPGHKGRTPLMYASFYGLTGSIEQLLDHPDIKVDSVDDQGNTALMIAANEGHTPVVKLLLPRASVDTANKQGNTALMFAATKGHKNNVIFLLQRADVELANENGDTASILAVRYGHLGVVRVLGNHPRGINTSVQNKKGETALTLAEQMQGSSLRSNKYSRIIRVLQKDDSDTSDDEIGKPGGQNFMRGGGRGLQHGDSDMSEDENSESGEQGDDEYDYEGDISSSEKEMVPGEEMSEEESSEIEGGDAPIGEAGEPVSEPENREGVLEDTSLEGAPPVGLPVKERLIQGGDSGYERESSSDEEVS